ncbi:Unknown protein [Striga hermonthica]|uniref:Uncharacterized protein n=1 Tax=Striga hermonthica TaxID=68872 RepID=A0A9N7NKH3_STRHE|nr:Unknown protein [Striga hermonthica]
MRMTSYIKSIDGRAWLSVLTGWEPPIKEVEGVKHEKNEAKYSTGESSLANFNSKALNAIFGTVDDNMFCLISRALLPKMNGTPYNVIVRVRGVFVKRGYVFLRQNLRLFKCSKTRISRHAWPS